MDRYVRRIVDGIYTKINLLENQHNTHASHAPHTDITYTSVFPRISRAFFPELSMATTRAYGSDTAVK